MCVCPPLPPSIAHQEKMQYCVERCHLTPGKYACFHNLENFKTVNESKSKGFISEKKSNLYFPQTFALTTISTCVKHFISRGKLTFVAYIVLFYFLLWTIYKVKHLQLARYYIYQWKFPLKANNHDRIQMKWAKFVEFHETKISLL